MFKIAAAFLFTGYIFLLRFISIAQIGPDWEIPYAILKKSRTMLAFGILFTIVSCILILISYRNFLRCPIYIKVIYICLLIIAMSIIGLGLSGIIYQLPGLLPMLSNTIKSAFWPTIVILLALSLILVCNKSK